MKKKDFVCRGEVTVKITLNNLTVSASSAREASEIARSRAIQAWVAMGDSLAGGAIERMLREDLPPVVTPIVNLIDV